MPFTHRLFSMLALAAACSPSPTNTVDEGGVDTLEAVVAVIPAIQDTAVASGPAAPDTTATSGTQALEAKVDSLRAELAQMTALLGPQTSGIFPAQNQPDTTESLAAGELAREAAQGARFFALRTFWALIVLGLAYLTVRTITWLLDAIAERRAAQRLFFKRLIPILRLAIWSFVLYFIIVGVFQIDQSGLLAAGAAAGVAIGFAAQDVLKNIFGGLIIILDKPFQVGDKITVDGTYGEVVSIGLRATRIQTPDDNLVALPNAKIVEGQVANANAGQLDCQVVIPLYLPGWVDVAKAKSIAFSAAATSRYAYLDKPIVVNVKDEFKETFLTKLMVKAYVLDTRYEFAFASDVTEAAKSEFLKQGMLPEMWPALQIKPEDTTTAWRGEGG